MGSLEKVVKLACKPKDAPPKSKYLETIIAATWDEEGAVHDVCRALQARFREPNVIVVFKALIVLHTMIRNGSTDNVLSYLSSSEVLHLRNVSAGAWEGYNTPQNMQHYALYLDSRIRAYRDMKHDAIAVQSEANRDLRLSQNIDAELGRSRAGSKGASHSSSSGSNGVHRSKTLAGRKLRVMTVEKGLLRETKAVQKQIDTLVECRFYLDDLQDPLTIVALRMLVQDLLILFSAGNEGVINVLEHYFEMSRVDAESALAIYRHFCNQCEKVVEFLGVAKKLSNILNVPIPNMKHAPLSLAGALKEYLDDPNFEQNRIEYKLQKESADRTARNGRNTVKKSSAKEPEKSSSSPSKSPAPAANEASSSSTQMPASNTPQSVADFFESIEQAQSPMFGPNTNIAAFQPQMTGNMFNPFMQQQPTGMPFGAQAFGQQPFGQMQPQVTGFMQPQATGFAGAAPNPFAQMQAPQQQQQLSPFNAFLQPQAQANFLQPQVTGANPFRQSVAPQMTGIPGSGPTNTSPFGQTSSLFGQQNQDTQNQPFGQMGQNNQSSPFGQTNFGQQASLLSQPTGVPASSVFSSTNPFPFLSQNQNANPSSNASLAPPRPGSAPIASIPPSSPAPEPVKTHTTGSRNPFGPVVTAPPPVPKIPTMFELMTGSTNPSNNSSSPSTANDRSGFAAFEARENAKREAEKNGTGAGSTMANVASSFSLGGSNGIAPQLTSTTSTTSSDSFFSSLSSQPTGATATSFSPSISLSPTLKPQTTGFGGVKAFKPSSSFGASLLESLPPIPGSQPTTPGENALTTGLSSMNINGTNGVTSPASPGTSAVSPSLGASTNTLTGLGALNARATGFTPLGAQPTGASAFGNFGGAMGLGSATGSAAAGTDASKSLLGVGLRPQMTGAPGVANPFRSTMFTTTAPAGGANAFAPGAIQASQSLPMFAQPTGAPGGAPSFGATLFGVGTQPGQQQEQQGQQQQQQQQAQFGSLI